MSFLAIKNNLQSNFFQTWYAKRELLMKIFMNLIAQLGITYYAINNEQKKKKSKYTSLYVTLLILGIIIILVTQNVMPLIKIGLFCILSYCMGILLHSNTNKEVIQHAMISAMSIFVTMFLIGAFMLVTGIKLGQQVGRILLVSLFLLILLRIIMGSTQYKLLLLLGIILFSIYTIYETNCILQKQYSGDFITASLSYYLDIINIFQKIVHWNK